MAKRGKYNVNIIFKKEMAFVNTRLNNYTFAVYVLETLFIIILHLTLFFVNIRLRLHSLMGTLVPAFSYALLFNLSAALTVQATGPRFSYKWAS